jgi:hypothetical protein
MNQTWSNFNCFKPISWIHTTAKIFVLGHSNSTHLKASTKASSQDSPQASPSSLTASFHSLQLFVYIFSRSRIKEKDPRSQYSFCRQVCSNSRDCLPDFNLFSNRRGKAINKSVWGKSNFKVNLVGLNFVTFPKKPVQVPFCYRRVWW